MQYQHICWTHWVLLLMWRTRYQACDFMLSSTISNIRDKKPLNSFPNNCPKPWKGSKLKVIERCQLLKLLTLWSSADFFSWPETKRSPALTTAIWIPAITSEKCWKQSTLAVLKPFRSLHFIRKSLISAVSGADKAAALMQQSQSSSRLRCFDA